MIENLVKKIVLGTAQLGFLYGINNVAGQPSREKSLEILNLAYKNGITIFDTANGYGSAEKIIGDFLENRKIKDKVKIITKLNPDIALNPISNNVCQAVANNLKESLKRLKVDSVNGCLFHRAEQIRDSNLVDCLAGLKGQKMADNIGVSVYEEEEAVYAANLKDIDYIEVPYNIFDQRLDRKFLKLARKNKKVVFARSVFLQGLFFMPENKIPAHLEKSKEYFKELDKIIGRHDLSRGEAALLFALSNKDIDYVIIGVDGAEHLKKHIKAAQSDIDFEPCLKELKKSFKNVEKSIISPNLWKK